MRGDKKGSSQLAAYGKFGPMEGLMKGYEKEAQSEKFWVVDHALRYFWIEMEWVFREVEEPVR